jgi:hypothetical protein
VVIFPALGIWEPAGVALPGFDVAPATPVAIASIAATAASVAILVHPNITPLPVEPYRGYAIAAGADPALRAAVLR